MYKVEQETLTLVSYEREEEYQVNETNEGNGI